MRIDVYHGNPLSDYRDRKKSHLFIKPNWCPLHTCFQDKQWLDPKLEDLIAPFIAHCLS